jgi:hypothetical protein
MFLRETSPNLLSTLVRPPQIRWNPQGLPRVQRVRNPWTRTPQTRRSCSPYSKGIAWTKARPWKQSPPPRTEDWRAKYLAWIDRGELPSDRTQARRIAKKAKLFTVIDSEFYKRAASGVLQRCIPIPHDRELIRDIHAGVCGHHAALFTLMGNVFRQGFNWPTAVADANKVMRTWMGANFTHAIPISQLTPCRPYPSHGRSPCGGWTSSGPCERHPRATPTCWLSWTSSPNGSRHTQSLISE